MAGKSGNRKHGRNRRKPSCMAYTADPDRPLERKLRNIQKNNPDRREERKLGIPNKTRWSSRPSITRAQAIRIHDADKLKVRVR